MFAKPLKAINDVLAGCLSESTVGGCISPAIQLCPTLAAHSQTYASVHTMPIDSFSALSMPVRGLYI